MRGLVAVVSLMLMLPFAAWGVIETYEFSDPVLEDRYHELSQELRCPKCQNQNIADSNAPISRDLRFLLHSQLEQGASDDEILGFMVARYGDFVRYRPAVDQNTVVLWYGPGIVAVIGLLGLVRHLVRKKRVDQPVTAEELAQLRSRLAVPEGESGAASMSKTAHTSDRAARDNEESS